MHSNHSPAERPVYVDSNLNQAGPNSPKASFASAAELGSEGISGASPSNTAPSNSISEKEKRFRLLRVAVDSLYLSFSGTLHTHVHDALINLKALAQSDQPSVQAQAQYVIDSHIFEVKDKGASIYPFVLDDNAYRIQLSPSTTVPMAYVKVSAEYLAHKGCRAILIELEALLSELGELKGTNLVSRIDLAADFVSNYAMASWDQTAWVTRAREIHAHYKDQHFTGWSIGMGGIMAARLYDKTREILSSGKTWMMPLWLPAGWALGDTVWRLEFEVKREVLKQVRLNDLESTLDNLGGLWTYATEQWLRLTIPNLNDSTRTRWALHPLWAALSNIDWSNTSPTLLNRFSNARLPELSRVLSLTHGALTTYMAMHRISDPHTAAMALIRTTHAHYAATATNEDRSYSELVDRRVAAKARRFNTVANIKDASTKTQENFDSGKE